MSAPVYNAAYSAAFAVEPYHAERDTSAGTDHYCAPELSHAHMKAARELVKRVEGEKAVAQVNKLQTDGYPKFMQPCISQMIASRDSTPGAKRKSGPGSRERIRTWAKFGSEFAELRDVAVKLLSCHATSTATELQELVG